MIEVRISDYMHMDSVAVWFVMKFEGQNRRVLRISGDTRTWDEIPDPCAAVEPTVVLENDAGRALLEALLRHYQGASDMHTVRADLLHERGRVDKLLGAMVELASRPQTIQLRKAET